MSYSIHPYAEIFPHSSETDFSALTHDILLNGLLDPIVLYQDQILDGRNRMNACANASVKPHYTIFEGDDEAALKFVISKNLCRRHLDAGQRAMVAARIANIKHGQNRYTFDESPAGDSTKMASVAAKLDVGKRSVERARKVVASGDDVVIAAVDSGQLPVATAERIVQLPKEERAAAIAEAKAPKRRAKTPPEPTPEPEVDPMDTDEGVELLGAFISAADDLRRRFGVDVLDAQWAKWRRSVK